MKAVGDGGITIEALVAVRLIRIELVDDSGRPLARLGYKIEFVGGTTRTGATDSTGKIEERNVPPGQFSLTLSD